MTVKLLPGFLNVKAKSSRMNIVDPLRTEKRTVPPQLVPGEATENVKAASETMPKVS